MSKAFVFLVTYKLNKSNYDYSDFHAYIKQFDYIELSDSCYIIATNRSHTIIIDTLNSKSDPNDSVYIVSLKNPWVGQGSENIAQWLKRYLSE